MVPFQTALPVHSNIFVSSQVYKSKTEAAKKEYLKALAAYRASLVSKVRNCHLFSPAECVK